MRAIFLGLATFILVFSFTRSCGASPVPADEVWTKAEHLGEEHDLDPLLIFAIACAESSLDAHADSGQARGLMQMTPHAWEEVTSRSFDEAWDWQENMEAAASYLQLLKSRLQEDDHYSWPVLVAAYHYGLGKIEQSRYDVTRLPQSRNLIYADLLKGRTPDLPAPAPVRPIEDEPAVYQPESAVAALAPDPDSLPPLTDGTGKAIAASAEPTAPATPATPAVATTTPAAATASPAQNAAIELPELNSTPDEPQQATPQSVPIILPALENAPDVTEAPPQEASKPAVPEAAPEPAAATPPTVTTPAPDQPAVASPAPVSSTDD